MALKKLCVLGFALASLTALPALQAGDVSLSIGVAIRTAPPPPRNEIVVVRPSLRHVWIPGCWIWKKDRHVWIAGRWDLPPREHAIYVPPRWDHRDDGYIFVDGRWQDADNATPAPACAATANATEIIVSQPPPAPRPESVGARPFPHAEWISGYWGWGNGAYIWNPGRWVEPPAPHSDFIEPHWEARDNGYAFCPGFWQEKSPQPSAPAQIYVTEPPPPPMREVMGKRPSHNHIWIEGNWHWHDGRYVWTSGHWDVRPHRHAVYVAPRWENHGHGFVLIEGRWR